MESFELYSFRFWFKARDSIHFPAGKPGNILRGAFGSIFRKIVCAPDCPGMLGRGVRECQARTHCPYARIFEPAATGSGPSGLADWPRPFVFRAAHLDGSTVDSGSQFWFDVNLFQVGSRTLEYFVLAFAQLAREGLGARRGRADLLSVVQVGRLGALGSEVYNAETSQIAELDPPIAIPLEAPGEGIQRLRVEFVTPTELKSGDVLAARPEFDILFGRARDRISTLRALYGAGPLSIDFREMYRRAIAVKTIRCDLQRVAAERRSSRTGQVHSIGGFVGDAEYEGELDEFLPYLEAASWTGVGRQCVWGKGELRIHRPRAL